MERLNITIPDGLKERAKSEGLNLSRVATIAILERLGIKESDLTQVGEV